MGNDGKRTKCTWDVGTFLPRKSKNYEEERQAGIQGQWQQESPAREFLEQVKCCYDTDCTSCLGCTWRMRRSRKRMHSRETCEWKSDEKDSCKKTKRKEKQPGVRTRRPLQEHSQGGDLTTLEANSQGKDPENTL